jgi:hypothetical protein
MAKYRIAGPIGYFGPAAGPTLHPAGSIIEIADDAPCSLYWIALDDPAKAAIAREQQRQQQLRGSGRTGWSAWGGCLPHGVGGMPQERTDGGPPTENWPPDAA